MKRRQCPKSAWGFLFLLVLSLGCQRDSGSTSPREELVLAPPPQAELVPPSPGKPAEYPSTESWASATRQQRERAERSFNVLRQRRVPVYGGPLFVEDETQARVQDATEVAKRALILWAVANRAEGTPRQEAIDLIKDAGAWDSVSPEERTFLEQSEPDPAVAQGFVWRLESLWVMLWALGYVDDLPWPADMCDVPRLVKVMRVQASNPDFVRRARLRDVNELLDAQDLTMRIHWAIRDASLSDDARVPADLDWSGDARPIEIPTCAGVGVVEERHQSLNWLVRFLDPVNWDSVDTPT